MIATTLGALLNAEPAIAEWLKLRVSMETANRLVKLSKLVAAELAIFHEQRNAAIKELGTERDATEAEKAAGIQGPVTEVTFDNRAAFHARMLELYAVPVTLDWAPLPRSAMGKAEVSGQDLLLLGPLVVCEEATI